MIENTSIMSLFAEFIDDEVELLILQKIIDNETNEDIINGLLIKSE